MGASCGGAVAVAVAVVVMVVGVRERNWVDVENSDRTGETAPRRRRRDKALREAAIVLRRCVCQMGEVWRGNLCCEGGMRGNMGEDGNIRIYQRRFAVTGCSPGPGLARACESQAAPSRSEPWLVGLVGHGLSLGHRVTGCDPCPVTLALHL